MKGRSELLLIGPSYIRKIRMKKQFIYFLSLFVMCLAACSNPVDPTALNLDSANINRLIPFVEN